MSSKTHTGLVLLFMLAFGAASSASAQLLAAKEGRIVYGHHHINATSVDAHRKFWVEALGGTAMKVGTTEIVKFPNVLVFLRERAPTGGTKGTTVNHIGFQVPDIRRALERVRAAGFPIVTATEVSAPLVVKEDLAFIPDQNTSVAFTMGPDETKVELFENKALTHPIALHHIHFAAQQIAEMKAWYVRLFGARPGMRGSFQAADLPGVNLSWMPSPAPLAGTKGRTLDHIGFEVKGLEDFCRQLEAQGVKFDRPYTKVAALNIAIAFFEDPYGTYIELTEGLDKY